MLIGFVQGYEELKWGISKLNPLCNGPLLAQINDLPFYFITLYSLFSIQNRSQLELEPATAPWPYQYLPSPEQILF